MSDQLFESKRPGDGAARLGTPPRVPDPAVPGRRPARAGHPHPLTTISHHQRGDPMPKPRSVLMGILSPVTVWGATRRVGVFKHVNSVSRRVDDLVAGTGTITVTFDPIP